MSIFQKSVVNKYLKSLDSNIIDEAYKKFKSYYGDTERVNNIRLLKEENYQEGFLREIFVNVLGYTLNPDPNYNLTTEFKNETDSKKADGAILENGKAVGVIELKSTKIKNIETITDQAFNYKNHHSNCKYVITSNFERIRLYIDDATEYEEFNLFEMNGYQFRFLYLFLSKESIINGITGKLKDESIIHEENITKKLYKDYSNFKHKIFNNLVKNNPDIDKIILLKKSQKLLDRLLFIFFAEDKGLLPPNIISSIIDDFNNLKKIDEYKPLYNQFKKYFNYIDSGHKSEMHDISAYNGELFKEDKLLDSFIIDDDILLEDSKKLSGYDFETEVDVDVLGHIFENSLSDIEELNAELEGIILEKSKSKRKKEGVYYTPKYITKYIVDNTLGRLCIEKKKELGIDNLDLDEVIGYRTKKDALKRKWTDILNTLEKYKDWLLSLKIVDPACGSGAFLVQALEYLINEHQYIQDNRNILEEGMLDLFAIEKSILENNLYGVDINEEAVEIAKLSLWLHTAHKGRKLSDLSQHIKCGNSLIADSTIAGEKAFMWEKEFSTIFEKGGFDIVIGNPPYVQIYKEEEYFNEKYHTASCGDLYALFIEQGINLVAKNGYFSYITPSLYIKGLAYDKLREYILENSTIIEIKELGDNVFENVQMPTAILVLIKKKHDSQKWDNFLPASEIIEKIELNNSRLKTFCNIKRGLEIGKDKVSSKGEIKILTGEDISRYCIKQYKYISDETYDKYKKDESYFNGDRVLIRETGNRITAIYINSRLQQNRSLYSIKIKSKAVSPLYLLGIINSSLMQFYYKSKFAVDTNIFPKIRIAQVKELPIVLSDNNDYAETISENALLITEKYILLNKYKNNFIDTLNGRMKSVKITKKIDEFFIYEYSDFIKELKKQKFRIGLEENEEWRKYFNENKSNILEIIKEIKNIDKIIDNKVYELYKLTEDEINIIESVN